MLMRMIRRLRYWLRARRHAADLAEEMAFHRELAGKAAFGNATLAAEDARAVWLPRVIATLWQDVAYTIRALRRQPFFALIAIGIVAVGIGATTCVFGLLDPLVVRPLPVHRPDRLVWFGKPSFSYPVFREVQSRMPVFDRMFGWNLDRAYVDWSGGSGELVPADVLEATGEFFSTLGVSTVSGRTWRTADRDTAVISHAAWQRYFGGDPSAIGRVIRVGDQPFTIVGIAPPAFFGVAPGLAPEVFVPIEGRYAEGSAVFTATTSSWLHLMARLRDDVSRAGAEATLQTVWPQVLEATTNAGAPADRRALYMSRTTSLEDGTTGFSRVRNQFGDPLRLLMALVTLLLLIACASVANLLLARGVARRKEIAIRLAIGASRLRVFRQLLTESLVITVAGAVLGLVAASWARRILVSLLTTSGERLALDTSADWRTAVFSLLLAVLVSLISAFLPALRASRDDVTEGLKVTRASGGLSRRWSSGRALVAVQVSLAIVLLSGAAVFGRSLARLLGEDPGIDTDRVLVVSADAAAAGYTDDAQREFDLRVLESLRALPGVESAALSWMPPISTTMGNWTQNIVIDGLAPFGVPTTVYFNGISPGYFATVGMRLRRGRDLADTDIKGALGVVVINETLARRFFGRQDPLGHRITIGKAASRKDLAIVGIVQDAKYRSLQEPPRPIGYLSVGQAEDVTSGRDLFASVRAVNLPATAVLARQAVRSLDPRVPVHIETVDDRIRESTVSERMIALLAGALGITALILACASLYGMLAYAVSRHTQEIGIRMALGATSRSLLWLVEREAIALALTGIVVGLSAATVLARSVSSGLLFGVAPTDPLALGAAALVMLFVAIAAGYLPARRAAAVDPLVALKGAG
jgi:predicted permease